MAELRSTLRPSAVGSAGLTMVATVAVLAGVALRWWLLATPLGAVDYDEAVVGLMARHMQHGDFTMFFWGQPYGGSQEPALVAALFALFGPHRLLLKLVPMVLHAAACLLTWRIGQRVGLGRAPAAMAALVLWCFPAPFVWWSTKERGFYGLALVMGLAAVLICLRLAEQPERPRRGDLLLLGGLAGLGAWVSPEVAYLAVPAVGWLLIHHRGLLRRSLPAAAAAALSASPWLWWNATHEWASLASPVVPDPHPGYVSRMGDLLARLPVCFGLEEPFSGRSLFSLPHWFAVAGSLAVLAGGAWVLRRTGSLLVWLAVGFVPLYATNPLVDLAGTHPRYLYLFAPVSALALAALTARPVTFASSHPSRHGRPEARRRPLLAVEVGVALATLAAIGASAWGLAVMHTVSRHAGGSSDLAAGPIDVLAARLDQLHINRVVTDRVGPQLTFATDEAIIGSNFIDERHPAYRRLTEGGPNIVYVLQNDLGRPPRLEDRLRSLSVGYRTERVADWTIVLPDHKVRP